MGNPVVHFEVMSADGGAGKKFYGELFGWSIQTDPEMGDYGLVDTQAGEGINGGVGSSQDGSSRVSFYIEVPDLEAALATIESLGGTRLGEPVVMPGIVSFAQFADPQGNHVGIVLAEGDGSEGAVSPGDGVPVGWFEVLGTDGPALREFYGKTFGWEFTVGEGPGDYGEVHTGSDRGIPGGIGTAQPGVPPSVTVYATVDDLPKYLERAEALGATTLLQPMEVGAGTSIAVFRDPQGCVFGMYKHVHPH